MSFESVYRGQFPALFRYAQRWTGDAEAAADLVQEAFVRYLRSSVPESEARLWLFRVAGNLMRDAARRRRRRSRLVKKWVWLREEAHDTVDAERSIEVERVRRALSLLAERDQQMLLMREEGFSYRQISEVVGIAPGSVGTVLARALQRFREAYESL